LSFSNYEKVDVFWTIPHSHLSEDARPHLCRFAAHRPWPVHKWKWKRTTWVSRYQKGKTILNLNAARDDEEMAVASAGPYANNLHFAPDR